MFGLWSFCNLQPPATDAVASEIAPSTLQSHSLWEVVSCRKLPLFCKIFSSNIECSSNICKSHLQNNFVLPIQERQKYKLLNHMLKYSGLLENLLEHLLENLLINHICWIMLCCLNFAQPCNQIWHNNCAQHKKSEFNPGNNCWKIKRRWPKSRNKCPST